MRKSRSDLRRRTAAQRAAIDARADAWQRPLSATQLRALFFLRRGPMHRVRIGFVPMLRATEGEHFSIATMRTLQRRGFVLLDDFESNAALTAAGLRAAPRRAA